MKTVIAHILILALALPCPAQQPTNIAVHHESGQTFVTWEEADLTNGLSYRVYRDVTTTAPMVNLSTAELLGEVSGNSSRNIRLELANSSAAEYWKVPNGSPSLTQLADDDGLFVVTVPEPSNVTAYYAVVSVGTPLVLTTNGNTTGTGISEIAAETQAYLQFEELLGGQPQPRREVWGHWGTNIDTALQERSSPWPSTGFNFQLVYQSDPPLMGSNEYGLIARFHGLNFNFNTGNPTTTDLFLGAVRAGAGEVVILGFDDALVVIDGTVEQPYNKDFWFGVEEDFDVVSYQY